MIINWEHVWEGWRNNLIPPKKLKKLIQQTSDERIAICKQCPFHSSNKRDYETIRWDEHCTICGCPLTALTKCLSCECSNDKLPQWKAVIDWEKEEQFNMEENENDIT